MGIQLWLNGDIPQGIQELVLEMKLVSMSDRKGVSWISVGCSLLILLVCAECSVLGI